MGSPQLPPDPFAEIREIAHAHDHQPAKPPRISPLDRLLAVSSNAGVLVMGGLVAVVVVLVLVVILEKL